MNEHTEEPTPDGRPDPIYSPLHEGQMSLMPEAEQPQRDYRPDDTASWSPVEAPEPAEETVGGPEEVDGPEVVDDSRAETDMAAASDADVPTEPDADMPMVPDTEAAAVDVSEPTEDVLSDSGSSEQSDVIGDASDVADEGGGADVDASMADVEPIAATPAADGAPEAAWPALSPHAAGPSAYDLPALDRERPARDRFVPKWVWIALASAVAVLALVAGGVWWFLASSLVDVPDVTGLQLSVARTRLEAVGLDVQVTDRRFSPAPRDEVLSQGPAAGGELRRGAVVRLVVSAGTEEIVMPDVVGDGLTLARAELEERGLVVIVDAIPSDLPSDTVLGTTPSPGAIVRHGDSVRVTVAAPVGGTNGLSPFNLQGFGLVLDPAPTGTAVDTTMEVARRVRSLLEASGASVTILRSASETSATDAQRALAASTATGTVALGLSIGTTGSAGRHVSVPVTGTPDALQRSQLLASSISSQLAGVAPPVTSSTSSTETVLQSSRLAWARIVLGSSAAREDQTRFADPAWADQMARAIYTALGELYGVREQ